MAAAIAFAEPPQEALAIAFFACIIVGVWKGVFGDGNE
jgi:hypothetical protein